ncbi:hypothetical protein Hanom_Chr04g00347101 [Helianthus anomalus]
MLINMGGTIVLVVVARATAQPCIRSVIFYFIFSVFYKDTLRKYEDAPHQKIKYLILVKSKFSYNPYILQPENL